MRTQLLRDKTRHIVDFAAKIFIYIGIPPNVISSFNILLIIAFFPLLKNGHFYSGGLIILLSGFFDVVDGAVAKAAGKSTTFGIFVDRTLDKISDGAFLAAYMLYGLINIPLGVYTLVVIFLATNVSANIESVLHLKVSNAVSFRFFRIIILSVFTILQQFMAMFIILAILSTYSLVHRLVIAFRYSRKDGTK
ncbi:CDP-alcohol phosphatidyltransferase family protein [Candidatus Woesearchaeota archaeon]|nr:CDP-alcohol phosphatidyltransferase family protein [Candidatus Woesearchaeota archaeon]